MAEHNVESPTIDPPNADPFAWESTSEDSIDLAKIIQALRNGRRTILLCTLACMCLALVIAFFVLPVLYTSTVAFLPPNTGSSGSMAASIAGQLSALGAGDLAGAAKGSGDLYTGILRSRSIASTLVKNFDLMNEYKVKKESDAEKKLAADTEIVPDAKSGIITVSVTGRSPQFAHDLAAAYMAALHDTNGRLAISQASQRRLFFGEQLEQEKNNLENAEVDLKTTEEQTGLIAPTGQTEAEIRTIADTQAQIAVRRVQLAALRQGATDENAEVVRLQSEIGDLEAQMSALQKGKAGSTGLTIPTSKVPQMQLDYIRKEREVKYHETLFEMLARQFEAARLDEARDAPVVQVLDPPSLPDVKSSPRRGLILLGGMLVGLLVGSIWVLVRSSAFSSALKAGASQSSA